MARSNPDGDAPAAATRGAVVAALDDGMALDIELAKSGDGGDDPKHRTGAKARVWKRYFKYAKNFARTYIKAAAGDAASGPALSVRAADVGTEAMVRVLYGHEGARGKHAPSIDKFNLGTGASFATFIGSVVKHVASEAQREYKRARGRSSGSKPKEEAVYDAVPEDESGSLSDVEDIAYSGMSPEEQMLSDEQDEGNQRMLRHRAQQLGSALDDMRAEHPEWEQILDLRAQGKTYKQIAAELGIGADAVGVRLYRTRKQIEDASGIALAKRTSGRPRRKNPGDDYDEEVDIYFETLDDLCALCDEGFIDADEFQDCLNEWLSRFG